MTERVKTAWAVMTHADRVEAYIWMFFGALFLFVGSYIAAGLCFLLLFARFEITDRVLSAWALVADLNEDDEEATDE